MMQLSAKKYYPNLGGKDVNKNKTLKVLATSAMLASVAAPFGAGVASANSTNLVDKVLSVNSNTILRGTSNLYVNEDDTNFGVSTGDTFRVVLPSGATWNTDDVPAGSTEYSLDTLAGRDVEVGDKFLVVKNSGADDYEVTIRTDQVLEIRPKGSNFANASNKGGIELPLYVKLNGASGDLKLKVESMDSTVTSGEYTFAVSNSGATVATVDEVKSIGKNGIGGRIRIEENALGSLAAAPSVVPGVTNPPKKELKLKLPSNFEWDADINAKPGNYISFGGDFATEAKSLEASIDGNTLTVKFYLDSKSTNSRGYIYVTPKIKAKNDAAKGEVPVNISGSDFSDADVVVAKYGDYGVDVKVEKVEEITAGKFDENTKTAKITIEETVPNSLVAGRDIDVQFPSWVKVLEISDWSVSGPISNVTKDTPDGKDDEFSINVGNNAGGTTNTTKGKIEFKVRLSVEANKTGDIEATIKGGGIEERKLVVAKAIAPATAGLVEGSEVAKLKIGAQDQAAPDFFIAETKKGTFEKNTEAGTNNGEIVVTLPDGVKFSKVPKVEVVEGDGTVETNNIRRINNDNALAIPVKGESISKPVKLKVSDVRLTLDRNVPEGPIEAKIGGSAVVENNVASIGWVGNSKYTGSDANSSTLNPGEFNTNNAVTFTLGTTVTPAPTDSTASNVVFKLNSKTYTVDGKELEMDAAPLVGWDRAYLPVRFAANALNVSDDQIIWDDKTSTFTVFKGDRVVSGKVGDKFLTVNGAKVPMDVPVWRNKAQTNNRVMVPIRYLANALNANIEWNKETSEITIGIK